MSCIGILNMEHILKSGRLFGAAEMMPTMEASPVCCWFESEQFPSGAVPLDLHAPNIHETLQQSNSVMDTTSCKRHNILGVHFVSKSFQLNLQQEL